MIQKFLYSVVAIQVDIRVRVSVTREELFHAKCSGTMNRSDKDDIAELPRNEHYPAQDERAHKDIAEFAVFLHERKQLCTIYLDHLARFSRCCLCEPAPARQHRYLPGEHPGLNDCYDFPDGAGHG